MFFWIPGRMLFWIPDQNNGGEGAAYRRQGMRGVRPRTAGPFSDARKGTKSARKGRTPYVSPLPPDEALMLKADLHPLPPPSAKAAQNREKWSSTDVEAFCF